MKALGKHILVEFYGCNRNVLNGVNIIKKIMTQAAIISGATIVDSVFHLFSPHGVSGVIVIAESHLTIHTWPEYGYAAVDLFTCGDDVDPWKAYEYLRKELKARNSTQIELKRGQINIKDKEITYKPFELFEKVA